MNVNMDLSDLIAIMKTLDDIFYQDPTRMSRDTALALYRKLLPQLQDEIRELEARK